MPKSESLLEVCPETEHTKNNIIINDTNVIFIFFMFVKSTLFKAAI